jgi:hypothetical protein
MDASGQRCDDDDENFVVWTARDFLIISVKCTACGLHHRLSSKLYPGWAWNNFRPRSHQTVVMNAIHCCHSSLLDTGLKIRDNGLQQRFPSPKHTHNSQYIAHRLSFLNYYILYCLIVLLHIHHLPCHFYHSRRTYILVYFFHSVVMCNFDLGVLIPSSATTVYIEVPLLEGTFYFFTLHVSA